MSSSYTSGQVQFHPLKDPSRLNGRDAAGVVNYCKKHNTTVPVSENVYLQKNRRGGYRNNNLTPYDVNTIVNTCGADGYLYFNPNYARKDILALSDPTDLRHDSVLIARLGGNRRFQSVANPGVWDLEVTAKPVTGISVGTAYPTQILPFSVGRQRLIFKKDPGCDPKAHLVTLDPDMPSAVVYEGEMSGFRIEMAAYQNDALYQQRNSRGGTDIFEIKLKRTGVLFWTKRPLLNEKAPLDICGVTKYGSGRIIVPVVNNDGSTSLTSVHEPLCQQYFSASVLDILKMDLNKSNDDPDTDEDSADNSETEM